MIIFLISLNFGSVKEILKMQCQIYILMEKLIIQRKIQVTMKTFAPPFFNDFNLSLNRKKCDVESHEKETKDIHVSDVDLLHINRKSRPVQMWTLQKRSEIALVVERWMQSLLLWLKLWGVREVSHQPVFMGNCRTIKPYGPSRSVLLFIPGIAEQN